MKLFDKLKNYFYDDEDAEEPKKSVTTKTERFTENVKHELKDENKAEKASRSEENLDAVSERELFKSDPTFNFPIIFDDEDFKTEKENKKRINIVEAEQTKVERVTEKKIFKPSPIISPIYGVVDYDENKSGNHDSADNLLNLYEENKKIDIDDVLGRVYSQSRVEVKRESYTEVTSEPVPTKDDLSIDLFNNISTSPSSEIAVDNTAKKDVKKVDEKLKSIDELLENTDEDDFYSLVDSMYKDDIEESDK